MDGAANSAGARALGDADARRVALVATFAEARAAGDGEAMAAAALAMPTSQRFGAHPGQIPALLFEAYSAAAASTTRCRLAAALARSWVYGGDAARAAQFADEALRLSVEADDAELTADALDAALLAHWGPDDFTMRLSLAARLDEVAAYVTNTDLRLSAHLWRLTTAWESLDIVAVQRQLRALDLIAAESGSRRAAFFAESRRAMYAIAMNDLVAADQYIAQTIEVGSELGEPDVLAVLHELNSMRLRTLGDEDALSEEATAAEAFGTAEGIASVSALAAVLWLSAGVPETAARIVSQLTSAGIENIPRDVDFLLTASCIVSVAAAVGLTEIATAGAGALEPYAGRGVINAGAVTFYGVVDDYIFRARRANGETDADRWRHAAQGAYRRIGASWWEDELAAPASPRRVASTRNFTMRRADTGTWAVGDEKNPFTLADLKGLHYLRHLVERPGVDIDALELSDAVAGHAGARAEQTHTGDTLDAAAVAAYRRRLAALDDELDAADERGDQTAAERVADERDALLAQLRSATGLGGRARRSGATSERARVAVRKAIAATVTQIERHDPSLARHLRDCVRTGASCRYEPNPDHATIWLTR